MDLELLFKVPPDLNRENAGVCFLIEHVLGPLSSITTFEKREGLENFLLFIVKLIWG